MDTSKEYIEMCRKAEEIQELMPICHINARIRCIKHQVYYGDSSQFWAGTNSVGMFDWLPRQDQLQEMIKIKECGSLSILVVFYSFAKAIPKIECALGKYNIQWSMEQLWLAFVMQEKFNKTWNGKEWVSKD